MKKIKIYGASGCGNVGDDLIALILKKYLSARVQGGEVSIIPQRQQIQESFDADAVVIGGGGLIYDYDFDNVRNYTDFIHLAHSMRIPVYMMGMGVQHVFTQKAVDAYTNALRLVKNVATRSEKDSKLIEKTFGYPKPRVITSRDLVFLYDRVFPDQSGQPVENKEKPALALSLADWQLSAANYKKIDPGLQKDYTDFREYLKQALPRLKDKFQIKIICQAQEDIEISKELRELSGGELITFDGIEKSYELISAYKASDYVITSRYHGLIGAIIANRPVICASFKGHKQQKLIDESFPSLKNQFYEVGEFAKKDVLGKFLDAQFVAGIKQANKSEYSECLDIAERHGEVARRIAGQLAMSL